MGIGKQIRVNRLLSHPSGRLCSVAIDHFPIYHEGLPPGLRHPAKSIAAIMAGQPDAITMYKGLLTSLWAPYAGRVPIILQCSATKTDDSGFMTIATPEEAIRLGADAMAVVAYVHGDTEAKYLNAIADAVREANRFDLPVICHVYPRDKKDKARVLYAPEDIAWAVHCIAEVGADVIKAPFCGDIQAHAQIVADCPVPLVVAGGPQTGTPAGGLDTTGGAATTGGARSHGR